MDIMEILNTQPKGIKWSSIGHINKGVYELDGDVIEILLEEFNTKFGKTLVEFGFSTNGSIQAKDDPKMKARLIGSVLNGASKKLKKLDPDVVLVCVNKKTGLVDSRKHLYSTIISRIMKSESFTYHHEWIENKVGFYALIAKEKLSDEEEQTFISMVKSK